jgi:hypothetical protein
VASTGALDGAAGRLGSAVGGLLNEVLGAGIGPSPSAETTTLEPPALRQPSNPYTNKPAIDIVGHLPSGVAGRRGITVRIYIDGELADQATVARTADFVVDAVPLPRGWSDVTATLVGPDGLESTPSEPIAVCFDDEVPPLEIVAPTDGQALNAEKIAVRGATQGGSRITIRNENTGAQTQGQASKEGHFEVEVPLGKGRNGLTVTVLDPAGNSESAVVSVVRGDGELTAELSVSESRIKLSSLPAELTISVNVLDPDGIPVEGAQVTFTLSPPGLPTETFEAVTANGVASWADVTIPKEGATVGGGFVTTTIVLPDGKVVEDTAAFTIY